MSCHRVNKTSVDDLLVDLTLRELSGGADDTPDDGCSTEHLCSGADEVILLVGSTHIFDVGEHPRLDTELDGTGNDGGEDLGKEQCLRTAMESEYNYGNGVEECYVRNLHVVTDLEVVGKLQRLGHGNVSPGLEQHHSNRFAGKQVADDKLSDDVQANLLVGNGLDDTDWNSIEETNNLCHGRST